MISRKLYFVINGGQYIAFGGAWASFVPASIFGEYYTYSSADKINKVIQFSPSIYCGNRLKRPLPEPFYGNTYTTEFSVNILPDGHDVVAKNEKYEVHFYSTVVYIDCFNSLECQQ